MSNKKDQISEITQAVYDGTMTIAAGYEALEELGEKREDHDLYKLQLSEEELRETTVGYYAAQANGWGWLEMGLGCNDKVKVENGKIVTNDGAPEGSLVHIGGKTYRVDGVTLAD